MKECDMEKPKSAAAVIPTLIAVTQPVPIVRISLALKRLEITVPKAIVKDSIPAYEIETPKSSYMLGQAEPSIESGKPKLIKDAYIIANKIENTKNQLPTQIIPHI